MPPPIKNASDDENRAVICFICAKGIEEAEISSSMFGVKCMEKTL